MRPFALTSLFAIAALNCFLASSGQKLANDYHGVLQGFGSKLPALTRAAFVVPPGFYAVAVAAVAVAGLGLGRKASDHSLVYAAVVFLLLDMGGLLVSLWGLATVPFKVSHMLP